MTISIHSIVMDEKVIDFLIITKAQILRQPENCTELFYNYIYYTVAGFTEHDTFRSNQIREGDLTRDEALELVNSENAPRYANIKWYLDTLGFDFKPVIETINSIPKLYNK